MRWPGRLWRRTPEASREADETAEARAAATTVGDVKAGGGTKASDAHTASAATPVERPSPGAAALFDALVPDGRHSILDLGLAGDLHLRLLSRYSRQIRFAGLLPEPPEEDAWTSALAALPPNTHHPYDVVLAWDILDRIDPPQRLTLMARLAELTAPTARLYAVVDTSGATTTRPLRSTLIDVNRVSMQPVGPPEPARPALLPAPVERLLAPFEVTQAFTLRSGLREYVALKRG